MFLPRCVYLINSLKNKIHEWQFYMRRIWRDLKMAIMLFKQIYSSDILEEIEET